MSNFNLTSVVTKNFRGYGRTRILTEGPVQGRTPDELFSGATDPQGRGEEGLFSLVERSRRNERSKTLRRGTT